MRFPKIPERQMGRAEVSRYRLQAEGLRVSYVDELPVASLLMADSEVAARVFADCVQGVAREELWVLGLDRLDRARALVQVAVGDEGEVTTTLEQVLASVRATECDAFLLSHNHPSLDPQPSLSDWVLTKEIADVADAAGLELVDHVIVAGGRYASLRGMNEEMFSGVAYVRQGPR